MGRRRYHVDVAVAQGEAALPSPGSAVYDEAAGGAGTMNLPSSRVPMLAPSRRFAVVVVALLLFGGSLLLYARAIGFGFIGYDENAVLLGHPNLYAQPSVTASIREIVVGYFPREEPLVVRDLSWLFDARLFGFARPLGYHLGNVVLNALDVVLLFFFLAHTTRRVAWAGVTAALFGGLAIHVEPVCWIMGRKDVLAAFFVLLALLLDSVALRQTDRRKRWLLHAAVLALCPLAILAKFSAIVLVGALAILRLFAPFLDGSRGPADPLDLRARSRLLLGLAPHLAVTAALYLWYGRVLAAFGVIGERGPSPLSWQHVKTLALFVPASLAKTLAHLAWPGEHAISYLRPNVGLPLSAAEIAGIAVFVLGSVAGLALCLRYRKDLAFFVLAFFCFMFPYFNIEYIGIWVADRYAYLSSFCVVAVLTALIQTGLRARPRWAKMIAVAATAIVLGLYVTGLAYGIDHQEAFHDARRFWKHELGRKQPSMLAFESAAKTAIAEAAAAEPTAPARARALADAVAIAEWGIRYYESQPWRPAPGYFSREKAHLGGLHSVLGLAATLAGKPPRDRLPHCQRAYEIMPNKQSALLLAQALLDMARGDPPDERLARESLGYFTKYVAEAKNDPLVARGLPSLLAQYSDAFPALAAEVRHISDEVLRP
jgi:hypothetical protein